MGTTEKYKRLKPKTNYLEMDKKNWKFRLGIVLIIVSCLFFALLLAIPFLDTTDKNKIVISAVFIVIGELLFWSGIFS